MRPTVVYVCLVALLGSCTKSAPAPSPDGSETPAVAKVDRAAPAEPEPDSAADEAKAPSPSPQTGAASDLQPRPIPSCEAPANEEMLAKARAYWKDADPSVSQFDKVIAGLPADPAMRSALARVLLPTRDLLAEDEEGNIGWCRAVWEGVFDTEPMELEGVEPTEIVFASGCARRALMLQMLEFLNACDLQASEASVKLLMSSDLHEPDHTAAFVLVEQAEHLKKAEAVLARAFDSGPQSLQKLAVERLVELGTVEAKNVLREASKKSSCAVAHRAARALHGLGITDALPDIEKAATPQEAFFQLCMLATDAENDAEIEPSWEPLIDEKGYKMTVDCRGWSKEDAESHGHCDPLSHRKRNPPAHVWGPTATCEERKGKVVCKSNPVNDNSGVANRVDPTWFTFAKRKDTWVLVDVTVKPKVTDAWEY